MAAVQVLERRKHAVDVVVVLVVVAPGRRFDAGQHVEDHEAVMPRLDVVTQPFDAAVVEQRKVVEQLEPAGGLDAGLDGAQAALDVGLCRLPGRGRGPAEVHGWESAARLGFPVATARARSSMSQDLPRLLLPPNSSMPSCSKALDDGTPAAG